MEITCPPCGKVWRLCPEASGQRLNCPQCGAPLPLGAPLVALAEEGRDDDLFDEPEIVDAPAPSAAPSPAAAPDPVPAPAGRRPAAVSDAAADVSDTVREARKKAMAEADSLPFEFEDDAPPEPPPPASPAPPSPAPRATADDDEFRIVD